VLAGCCPPERDQDGGDQQVEERTDAEHVAVGQQPTAGHVGRHDEPSREGSGHDCRWL
jgi:hypothetical protein